MIFVTVGTQAKGFLRCLQEVEKLIESKNIKEDVVAQIGHTDFNSKLMKTVPFVGENEYRQIIRDASLIITHAGSGALFNSIKTGKKIIAMARLKEFNEMIDDHQMELVRKLSEGGYIIDGSYSLSEAWDKLPDFNPRANDFKCEIVPFLDKYISDCLNY